MGRGIFKVDDNGKEAFIVWSSVVDAPVSFACTAEEIVEMFVEDARESAVLLAQEMIERARENRTSSRMGMTLADVATENRAGPAESTLTEDEIIEFYVRRKQEPTAVSLAAYRKKR